MVMQKNCNDMAWLFHAVQCWHRALSEVRPYRVLAQIHVLQGSMQSTMQGCAGLPSKNWRFGRILQGLA